MYSVLWPKSFDLVDKNITEFILEQKRQLEDAIEGLQAARDALNPMR